MERLSIGCIQRCTHLSKAGLKDYGSGVTNDVTVNSLQLQSAAEMKGFASFFCSHSGLLFPSVLTPFCWSSRGVME